MPHNIRCLYLIDDGAAGEVDLTGGDQDGRREREQHEQRRIHPTGHHARPASRRREHILDAAENLFYWHGITATAVDRIAAEAGIAPTTLYRLFRSKDALVAAYVDRYAAGYQGWIESLTSDPTLPAAERILALFDGLLANTGPEAFRGCPFLMVLAEYPDSGSAAHASAQAVKAWCAQDFTPSFSHCQIAPSPRPKASPTASPWSSKASTPPPRRWAAPVRRDRPENLPCWS